MEEKELETKELCAIIADSAKEVRKWFTPGYEENVYKNAMYLELRSRGLVVETEVPFEVRYKNHVVGSYRADMIVNRKVIVELKSVNALAPIHSIQLVNYLTATGINEGMLINFGSETIEIRHKDRIYQP